VVWEQRLKPHGVSFRLLEHTLTERLPPPVEIVLFSHCPGGLTNIVRHARANSVSVRLLQQQEDVTLEICDDGVGFDPSRWRRRSQTAAAWACAACGREP